MHRLVVVLFLVLPLAGCSDDAGPQETEASDEAEAEAIEAPAWSVGDWWTYDLSGLGTVTWAVTQDAGDAWVVDVDHADMAFFHAAFGQVSTVGSIGKTHLDGSQEHGAVHFLDFPLHDNKTWRLTWDGIDFDASVQVDGERAHVTATAADGRVRTYTYDAAARWFRSIEALDPNGTVEFSAAFQRGGHDYPGELVRWTVHDVHAYHMGMGDRLFERFQVPQEATDVWYSVTTYCDPAGAEGDQGAYTVNAGSESSHYENGVQVVEECPNAHAFSGALDPDPGDWGVVGASAGGIVDLVLVPRSEERFGVEAEGGG